MVLIITNKSALHMKIKKHKEKNTMHTLQGHKSNVIFVFRLFDLKTTQHVMVCNGDATGSEVTPVNALLCSSILQTSLHSQRRIGVVTQRSATYKQK